MAVMMISNMQVNVSNAINNDGNNGKIQLTSISPNRYYIQIEFSRGSRKENAIEFTVWLLIFKMVVSRIFNVWTVNLKFE